MFDLSPFSHLQIAEICRLCQSGRYTTEVNQLVSQGLRRVGRGLGPSMGSFGLGQALTRCANWWRKRVRFLLSCCSLYSVNI